MPALAGANLIYGLGMIESGVTFDCGQLVMDNEFARMIKQCVRGIPVDDETLAVDDIARVGAFGDFLSLDATLRHMRELSQPELLDRRVREDWEERGSTDLHARAWPRPARCWPSTGRSRWTTTSSSGSAASSRRPTVWSASRDRVVELAWPGPTPERGSMKEQFTQALIAGDGEAVNALTQALLAAAPPRARSWMAPCCPPWRWSGPAHAQR